MRKGQPMLVSALMATAPKVSVTCKPKSYWGNKLEDGEGYCQKFGKAPGRAIAGRLKFTFGGLLTLQRDFGWEIEDLKDLLALEEIFLSEDLLYDVWHTSGGYTLLINRNKICFGNEGDKAQVDPSLKNEFIQAVRSALKPVFDEAKLELV